MISSLAMIKQIVINSMRAILTCMLLFVAAGCGQKGPLQPQPMPEQNQPTEQPQTEPVAGARSE